MISKETVVGQTIMKTKRMEMMTLAMEKRVTLAETAMAAAEAEMVPRVRMSSKKKKFPTLGTKPTIQ